MARDWNAAFEAWGRPPSDTEQDERRRTEAEIAAALLRHPPLQNKRLRVYAKGSYRRGTNVRRGSDVDIAVELQGLQGRAHSFLTVKYFDAANLTDSDLDLTRSDIGYTVRDLKQDVFDALTAATPRGAVTRSNKCIKVRERATTLPADVVPCQTHRRYDSATVYHEGIEIHPDKGAWIVNWPQQDDTNGTEKNKRTSLRYKRAVRGIKSLENEMVDSGYMEPVASFLIECAVYNVPDWQFDSSSNYVNCLHALREMGNAALDASIHEKWSEVNQLKYLFNELQTWTVADIGRLVSRAMDYLESR